MVFTLGFFSILAFGGILAVAGFISSAIFDDAMVRLHLKAVTHPLVASFVWGCCYYAWMLALAVVTTGWKHARVGDEDFQFSDGFWFAYISSTTIGACRPEFERPVTGGHAPFSRLNVRVVPQVLATSTSIQKSCCTATCSPSPYCGWGASC